MSKMRKKLANALMNYGRSALAGSHFGNSDPKTASINPYLVHGLVGTGIGAGTGALAANPDQRMEGALLGAGVGGLSGLGGGHLASKGRALKDLAVRHGDEMRAATKKLEGIEGLDDEALAALQQLRTTSKEQGLDALRKSERYDLAGDMVTGIGSSLPAATAMRDRPEPSDQYSAYKMGSYHACRELGLGKEASATRRLQRATALLKKMDKKKLTEPGKFRMGLEAPEAEVAKLMGYPVSGVAMKGKSHLANIGSHPVPLR